MESLSLTDWLSWWSRAAFAWTWKCVFVRVRLVFEVPIVEQINCFPVWFFVSLPICWRMYHLTDQTRPVKSLPHQGNICVSCLFLSARLWTKTRLCLFAFVKPSNFSNFQQWETWRQLYNSSFSWLSLHWLLDTDCLSWMTLGAPCSTLGAPLCTMQTTQ